MNEGRNEHRYIKRWLIVASFRTCLAQVSEQQHLPLLVGPCGDLEMSVKSCWLRIPYNQPKTVRLNQQGQGQICTKDGLLPPLTDDSTKND